MYNFLGERGDDSAVSGGPIRWSSSNWLTGLFSVILIWEHLAFNPMFAACSLIAMARLCMKGDRSRGTCSSLWHHIGLSSWTAHFKFRLMKSVKSKRSQEWTFARLTEQGHIHDQKHHEWIKFCNIKTFDIWICTQLSAWTHSECQKVFRVSIWFYILARLALCLHPSSERFPLVGD